MRDVNLGIEVTSQVLLMGMECDTFFGERVSKTLRATKIIFYGRQPVENEEYRINATTHEVCDIIASKWEMKKEHANAVTGLGPKTPIGRIKEKKTPLCAPPIPACPPPCL